MKVKAKCNIKFGSEWIPGGKVWDVSESVYNSIRDLVEVIENDVPEVPKAEPAAEPEPISAETGVEEQPKPKAARAPRRTTSTKK